MSDTSRVEVTGQSKATQATVSAGISLLLIVGFTVLTALGALFRIPLPFTPVPVTLQTLMVLLAGAMLGSTRGALSQVLYAAWGVAGLPMFAFGATGLAVLMGPTGGYIIGFALAAILVGRMIKRTNTLIGQALVFSLGTLVILLAGTAQLAVIYTGGDVVKAVALGLFPFLPGAVFKVVAATAIWRAWTVLRKEN